jgi:hypothetical protein
LLSLDEFSASRLPNAAALLERLRSFGCVVIAAQSTEGLHDAKEVEALTTYARRAGTWAASRRISWPEDLHALIPWSAKTKICTLHSGTVVQDLW